MKKEQIYTITTEDVQSIANYYIGRELSEDGMEFFSRKFQIDDWTDLVKDYIDYTVKEVNK
jgi:HSP90 family molecular chaperone